MANRTQNSLQADLFGTAPEPPAKAGDPPHPREAKHCAEVVVEAASPDPAVLQLARTLPASIRLGTSSWSFPGWRGLVYADRAYTETKLSRDGLHAYSAHPLLQTVSLDRTFYAPLPERDFERYAAQVSDNFRFIVKAPQAVTSSYARDESGNFSDSTYFLDASYAIDNFIAPCAAGLGPRLGAMVFQFPPLSRRDSAAPDAFINRLYRFLTALPPGLPYAVEVRNPELLTDRFFKCLQASASGFCVASHARMPSPREQLLRQSDATPVEAQTGPFLARWSLHAGFKYEDAKARYFPFNRLVDEDLDTRTALASAAVSAARRGRPTLITINNKAEGSAPLSVEKLAALIAEQRQTVTEP